MELPNSLVLDFSRGRVSLRGRNAFAEDCVQRPKVKRPSTEAAPSRSIANLCISAVMAADCEDVYVSGDSLGL